MYKTLYVEASELVLESLPQVNAVLVSIPGMGKQWESGDANK